jgi:hypothetical protein
MKRRTTLGMLSTDYGAVPIRNRVVAHALQAGEREVERLNRAVEAALSIADDNRKRAELAEGAIRAMGGQLIGGILYTPALHSHWWVRLGRALHVIRLP